MKKVQWKKSTDRRGKQSQDQIKIKRFGCAYRCTYCNEMNVTQGTLQVHQKKAEKEWAKYRRKINEKRRYLRLDVAARCAFCGAVQLWQTKKEERLKLDGDDGYWMIDEIALIFIAVYILYMILVPFNQMKKWVKLKIHLRAMPKKPEYWPYIGDEESAGSDANLAPDDPRPAAILKSRIDGHDEGEVKYINRWICVCGQENPVTRGFCTGCGKARPRY